MYGGRTTSLVIVRDAAGLAGSGGGAGLVVTSSALGGTKRRNGQVPTGASPGCTGASPTAGPPPVRSANRTRNWYSWP